jgi:hypothetical protein
MPAVPRAGDALFNLADALLSESQAKRISRVVIVAKLPLAWWPSVYEALEDGKIDVEKLRRVWVEALLAARGEDELIWIAVDSSVIERPDAQTSEDRGIIHLSNLPLVRKPVGVGWTMSSVVLLPDTPSSWTPILDVERVATKGTPIQVAIAQLQALKPLFGKRRVILRASRGYGTPEFLRACHELGISVLVRIKRDRRRLTAPRAASPQGTDAPSDGSLFQGKRCETHGVAESEVSEMDASGKAVRTSRWSNLHWHRRTVASWSPSFALSEKEQKTPNVILAQVRFVMLDSVIPLSRVASGYGLRFSEGGMAIGFSKGICFGRLPVCAPLLSLSAGAGW